jgi:hypothetical protein
LDNNCFIRYIYFKCNKVSAGALIASRDFIAAPNEIKQAAQASNECFKGTCFKPTVRARRRAV